jgi:queuosine precursor transporter
MMKLDFKDQKYSIWFVLSVALFITSLITANIIAVKLVGVGPFAFPAAVVIFPISYIFGDILTEVYGYARARQVIWLGFLCNLITVIAIYIAQILPAAGFWQDQNAFVKILGLTPRILLASFIAYLIGEFANSFVLAKLKLVTEGRFLWIRTIGSTIIGEGLDSLVFISLAFYGTIPSSGIVTAILTQWTIKVAYETLATPITYAVVTFLKRQEGVEIFDRKTNFNPIKING